MSLASIVIEANGGKRRMQLRAASATYRRKNLAKCRAAVRASKRKREKGEGIAQTEKAGG